MVDASGYLCPVVCLVLSLVIRWNSNRVAMVERIGKVRIRPLRDYFPATLEFHNRDKLRENVGKAKSVMFACHPHGILATSTVLHMSLDTSHLLSGLPAMDLHGLTLDMNLRIPFLREWLMAFGPGGVSRQSCLTWLKSRPMKGKPAVALVPGGARETLYAVPNTLRLVLEKRLNSLLVPVLCLGENEILKTFRTFAYR
jgi:hypothetical protein